MNTLINKLERHLGEICHGWSNDELGNPSPIQIVECAGGIYPNTVSLATVGLSRYALQGEGKKIRHELFLSFHMQQPVDSIALMLQEIAQSAILRSAPILCGEVVRPVRNKTDIVALFAYTPVYYPEEFWAAQDEFGSAIVIVWLVPMTRDEAEFVEINGAARFEELLAKADPDLFDLNRPSIELE